MRVVDCVHDNRPNGDLLRSADNARKRVIEQSGADPMTLLAAVDRKARKDRDWDWRALR